MHDIGGGARRLAGLIADIQHALRRREAARALLRAVAAALASVAAAGVFALAAPPGWAAGLIACAAVSAAAGAGLAVGLVWRRRPTALLAARLVEARRPELKNALVTFVELAADPSADSSAAEAIARRAAHILARDDTAAFLPPRSWLRPAACAAAGLVACAVALWLNLGGPARPMLPTAEAGLINDVPQAVSPGVATGSADAPLPGAAPGVRPGSPGEGSRGEEDAAGDASPSVAGTPPSAAGDASPSAAGAAKTAATAGAGPSDAQLEAFSRALCADAATLRRMAEALGEPPPAAPDASTAPGAPAAPDASTTPASSGGSARPQPGGVPSPADTSGSPQPGAPAPQPGAPAPQPGAPDPQPGESAPQSGDDGPAASGKPPPSASAEASPSADSTGAPPKDGPGDQAANLASGSGGGPGQGPRPDGGPHERPLSPRNQNVELPDGAAESMRKVRRLIEQAKQRLADAKDRDLFLGRMGVGNAEALEFIAAWDERLGALAPGPDTTAPPGSVRTGGPAETGAVLRPTAATDGSPVGVRRTWTSDERRRLIEGCESPVSPDLRPAVEAYFAEVGRMTARPGGPDDENRRDRTPAP
jgi:hypothetical protein